MNSTGRAITLYDSPDDWLAAFYGGWRDAIGNLPWPLAHDTLTRRQQIAYEQGRLWIVAIRAARVRIPRWDGARSGCGSVQHAMQLAKRRIGMPVHVRNGTKPPARLEPPPPRLY